MLADTAAAVAGVNAMVPRPYALVVCAALVQPATAQTEPAPPPAAPAAPAQPAPTAEPITPLDHIETRGDGPVHLILVPALVCDWSMYEAFMLRNKGRFTMHAVTLPGFGAGKPPPAPPEGSLYAAAPWLANAERAILKLVEDKKLEKPVIMGVSTGGHIALRTAIRNPDAFGAVININGLPAIPLRGTTLLSTEQRARIIDEEYGAQFKAMTDQQWASEQAAWIRYSFPDPDHAAPILAAAARVPKSTSGRYMLEYFASDLTEQLAGLKLPLLALSSVPPPNDPEAQAFRDSWRAAYGKLISAKLVYFEGSTEFVTEDSPLELDRAIEQFLAGGEVEGKGVAVKEGVPRKTDGVRPAPASVPPAVPTAPPTPVKPPAQEPR